jgi:hypothetical protein
MDRIHGNLEATTLWVWYDLVMGVGSDHDGIKNEATTQSLRTVGTNSQPELISIQGTPGSWAM